MHYKRERSGRPVRPPTPTGSPSGCGQYGILDDDGETLLCHECGGRYRSLGQHVSADHDVTVREYKLRHGLPLSRGLLTEAQRQARSADAASRVGSAGWSRLEAARDPVAASAARDEHALARVWQRQAAAERAADVGRATRRPVVRACPICGATWCPLPGGYDIQTCSPQCWRDWQAVQSTMLETPNAARDDEIRRAHAAGASYARLAERYGVTPARIRQIVHRIGR